MSHTLRPKNGRLAPSGLLLDPFGAHLLKHGRVLQHVGQYKKSYFTAADEDVLELSDSPVTVCDRNVGHLAVHVVFGLQ